MAAENGFSSRVPIPPQFMISNRNKHVYSPLDHNIPATKYST